MVTTSIRDGMIFVNVDYWEKDTIQSLPGAKWKAQDKTWVMPLTWASCVTLRGAFGADLELTPESELNLWAVEEYRRRVGPMLGIRELLTDGHDDYRKWFGGFTPDPDNDHDAKLFPYQRVGRSFLATGEGVILCDEMGTGKTVQVLSALRVSPDSLPALVVCPNSVKTHWESHVNEWLPEANPIVLTGSTPKRRKALDVSPEVMSRSVVIINVEGLRNLSRLAPYGSVALKTCVKCKPTKGDPTVTEAKCETHSKALNEVPFKTIVIDEAHRVKTPQAKQTRAITALAHGHTVTRRWAMTGTPISNHPGDVWSLMNIVAKDEFPTKEKFIDRYVQQLYNPFGGVTYGGLRSDTRDEFFKFFDPRMRRILKHQVLPDLPPFTRIRVEVEMSPKQRKVYNEIKEKYFAVPEDGSLPLVATNGLTARVRLSQLASSSCHVAPDPKHPDDPSKLVVTPANPSSKIDALVDILHDRECAQWDGTGNPVVVSFESRKLLELTGTRLEKEGIEYVTVTGTDGELARKLAVERLQSCKVPVLMMTSQAGGTGLTMTSADTLIRVQRPRSLIDNLQVEGRVHRVGTTHRSITVIDLVTVDSVEMDQMDKLAEKLKRFEELVRDRKRLSDAGLPTDHLDAVETEIMSHGNLWED